MVSVCFYFQVHQPFRLRHYRVFDIGKHHNYFDVRRNHHEMDKIAKKCYIPTNNLLLKLIHDFKGRFKVSFSITGTAIEQFEKYAPEVLDSFKQLAKTGCVEFISETYYHSLSFLYSREEFREQVLKHRNLMKKHFNAVPEVFRNTELIYNNELAAFVESMGYKGILAEGADHILGWRSPNFVYKPAGTKNIRLLLKNYRLSDDIAFRFSNRDWEGWPLTAEKFADWVSAINGSGDVVNLFMDYETFGEHQWKDTGIFKFLENLPGAILRHRDNNFKTVSEVIDSYPVRGELDIPHFISWADIERDLSAWLGNKLQQSAIHYLYDIEKTIKETKDESIISDWRKLTTSDHFYYMCTKWFADGDVHKYFNP
ncbi:alpha-amylase, partial [Candidatus Woesearchaeota archaeon]